MGADESEGAGGAKRPIPVRPSGGSADPSRKSGPPPSARATSEGDARPTPVRASLDGHEGTSGGADPEEEEIQLALDGSEWVVRVNGRTRAGVAVGGAPILMLGFFDDPAATVPRLEALVVGRSLSDMSEGQIDAAFRLARPPSDPAKEDFFPEASSRRRKGDG